MSRDTRFAIIMGRCWVEEWMSGVVRAGDRGEDLVDVGVWVSVVV
jgi:hypothetical protein